MSLVVDESVPLQQYIADKFGVQVSRVVLPETAQEKKEIVDDLETWRGKYCGASYASKQLWSEFTTSKYDPVLAPYQSWRQTYPEILTISTLNAPDNILGFIMYKKDIPKWRRLTLQNLAMNQANGQQPLGEILTLCTAGQTQCLGQILAVCALMDEYNGSTTNWFIELPENNPNNLVPYFTKFGFTKVAANGPYTYLGANTANLDAQAILNSCFDKRRQILQAQAAVLLSEAKEEVKQVAEQQGLSEPAAEQVAVAAISSAASGDPPASGVPPIVAEKAEEKVADMQNELKETASTVPGSIDAEAEALQALGDAVVKGSRLSTKQKLALFGVFSGGLIGLAGILNLAAKKKRRW